MLSGEVAEKTKKNPLGAGRNPRAASAAEHRVTIRITDEERAAFQAAADETEVPLGEWVRRACTAALRRRRGSRRTLTR